MSDLDLACDLMTREVVARFLSKFQRPAEGCWIWRAGLDDDGYGQFFVPDGTRSGINVRAHRLSFRFFVGRFNENLHLDHLCRRPWCVRPDHLEPVPPKVNGFRGVGPAAINAKKTVCVRGHAFTQENTLVNARGSRVCRECKRTYERDHPRKH